MNSTSIDSLQIGMHWFNERPGGLDRMYQSLIDTLPAQGVSVRGMVAGSPGVFDASGGRVQAFAAAQSQLGTRLWRSRRQSLALRTAKMPDVVASHFALYAAPTVGVFRRVPKVVHFHGPWGAESYPGGGGGWSRAARIALERFVYRGATRHIVLSHAFGRLLHETYGVREDRIRIVPGCVDVEHFDIDLTRREARERLGLPQDRPLLFCIRRLVSRMGIEDLIDAMAIVKPLLPDVLLAIAGKGPLEAQLQARIRSRGLEEHVRLVGFVPDDEVPLWYRASDLSIVPTVSLEGFGLTTIESLAAGTPVLVTPVGGLPEAVAPLSSELVLQSSGYRSIGEGIVDTLQGRRVLPDSAACRAYARGRFDRPVVAAQVADVYREAIGAF
ncbi:glycosyltransferase family 4 protein [Paraburkholderia susongensis]|uniref:Glycosyltransferase involved in cell wall bisynthesis n=1 Tax=Paraburkholderia susongensis TaxID=1515439 RepID=A0A1X7JEI7_9BURK|nr:glycosyltransferase family 4 protein [Paraburkholderia susongensis]SMG26097.1 Glycosyltransferase involved in cell wall bisynthesis [Paraburkholderia susongensis]